MEPLRLWALADSPKLAVPLLPTSSSSSSSHRHPGAGRTTAILSAQATKSASRAGSYCTYVLPPCAADRGPYHELHQPAGLWWHPLHHYISFMASFKPRHISSAESRHPRLSDTVIIAVLVIPTTICQVLLVFRSTGQGRCSFGPGCVFGGKHLFFPLTSCVFIICSKFFSLMAPNIRCGCHIWQGVISLGGSRPPPPPSSHLGNKGDLGCGSAWSRSGGYSPGWDPVPHLSPLGGFVGPGVIWLGGACIFPSPPPFSHLGSGAGGGCGVNLVMWREGVLSAWISPPLPPLGRVGGASGQSSHPPPPPSLFTPGQHGGPVVWDSMVT